MKYYVSRLSENRGQMQASTYNTSREDPGSDRSSVPPLSSNPITLGEFFK